MKDRERKAMFAALLVRDGPVCSLCGVVPATLIEHVWPRRLGGTDHPYNLRLACRSCNSKKRCTPPGVLPLFVEGDPWGEWQRYRVEQRLGPMVGALMRRGESRGGAFALARRQVDAELAALGLGHAAP